MERLFVKFSLWVFIILVQMNAYKACLEQERIGLLQIRAFIKSNCEIQDNLDSWVDDRISTNCCDWDRITCNSTSQRVIVISLNFTTGSKLGSPDGFCSLNLSLFHPFEELLSLDLSHNAFDGWIDHEGFERLSSLKKLQVLDLGSNYFNSSILSSVSSLVSLKTLVLRSNGMGGSFPSKGLCGLKSLVELGLSTNQFSGPLPQCIGNLTNLQVLDLTSNLFGGNPLSVVSEIKSLKYLFLSGNKFEGSFSFSALANHSKLEIFQLSSGNELLELETETHGWLPKFQLKIIDLPNCNFNVQTRKVPSFLLYQYDIRFIDLSHNNLFGTFPSWILQNNSKLEVMNVMNNSFTGPLQLPNLKHDLVEFEISSNNITNKLPKEFGFVFSNLIYVNLSKNSFEGNIPSSIGEIIGLSILDLSNNNFSGELPGNLFVNLSILIALILSNNNFHGNIFPKYVNLPELYVLDMNNNSFSGNVSVDLLNIPGLSVLDISSNKVSGRIPIQLCNLSSIEILDLSKNMLFGSLPSCFNASSLRFLFLQKNSLNGLIPHVISRSPDLVALDLRDNKFSGTIPSWISQLSTLRVLSLGGNALSGNIPTQLCQLRNLNIIDLSRNSFHGSIPSCFNNLSFGMTGEDEFQSASTGVAFAEPVSSSAQYNATLELDLPGLFPWSSPSDNVKVEFAMKNRYNSYLGYIINSVAGIDLSRNELTGSIPQELGDLGKILSLNLSHNHLTGSIPVSFSNLKSIESLDLHNNNLSGEIPTQLAALNFLGTFNVAYNNLSGRIPDKAQFGTFSESSYRGNLGLCGDIIHRSCNLKEAPSGIDAEEEEEEEGAIDMEWFYWSLCASYVTILMGLVAILYVNRRWRMVWFYYVHVCIYSIFGIEFYY
ncbi:receptor-like protein 9a isoform X2 [Jatropha curcas]|uniref:receptor-like protein 9a isoform X2 n=1 Tax=Jatropha curcas TaxID=180498 RepID=UPI0009D6E623|nr:receptor-like protein 9a isoform X2 [Jatropha curcas]